jgi:2-methylisocitrate lyase-like PEP mutase family enzyme
MMDAMTSQQDKAERFLALHHGPEPLLIPNPWDAGSARLLEWLGFAALATTSSGFAATLARLDGSVSREEALAHAAAVTAATTVPVSADLENGFADSPEGVAETVRAEAGVSRISVGGALAHATLGALVEAATELRDRGTYGYLARASQGRAAVQEAFGAPPSG